MIIWLASYPRSGNTLLRTILKQSFEHDSYDYEARYRDESITEHLTSDAREIIGHKKFTQQWPEFYKNARESADTFFVKTHSPPMDNQPAIYVVRDGRSAIDSYLAYHKSYGAGSKPLPTIAQLILGDDYYGSWSESFVQWNDGKRPLLLLRYEDIVNPDADLLKKIADFIDCNKEPKPFVNPMNKVHERNPDFFRQGKVKWQSSRDWSEIDRAVFIIAHAEPMLAMGYVTVSDIADAKMVLGNEQSNYLVKFKNAFSQRNAMVYIAEQKELVIGQLKADLAEVKTDLIDKELVIGQLKADLAKIKTDLIDKESVIHVLSKAVTAYRVSQVFSPASMIKRIAGIGRMLITPRLGNLNQYDPRPLALTALGFCVSKLANTPKVSIVTPSFQQGDFIERTIQSVLSQQYPNIEYFVQDGGSKDGTLAVLKRYEGKLSGWVSEKDSGQSQAINLGFAHTTGDIMAWLNSDDLLLPGALAIVIDYFNKHPEIDVVYGNRLLIDENDMEIGRWILPGHDGEVLSWADYIPQETMFWRRSIWDKAGGKIDESFRFAMDWDLLVRFREAGAKFAHIPLFLGAFRIHEQQKTSAAINEIGYQEMNRIRKRLLGREPLSNEIHKKVMTFMLKHIAVDFFYKIKLRINPFLHRT